MHHIVAKALSLSDGRQQTGPLVLNGAIETRIPVALMWGRGVQVVVDMLLPQEPVETLTGDEAERSQILDKNHHRDEITTALKPTRRLHITCSMNALSQNPDRLLRCQWKSSIRTSFTAHTSL